MEEGRKEVKILGTDWEPKKNNMVLLSEGVRKEPSLVISKLAN